MHRIDEPFREVFKRLRQFGGSCDNLVVDIRNVADIFDGVPPGPQYTDDHVKDHQNPGVAEVAVVVDRHTANIHTHVSRLQGLKKLLFAGQTVVNLKCHRDQLQLAGGEW